LNSGWKAAWLLTLASGLLLGSACSVDREVGRAIRRELPKVLGPADSYEVSVHGTRMRENSVHEVSVVAIGLRPRPEFRIERLEAKAWEVQVDPKTRTITKLGNLDATVTITTADTESFISAKPWLGRVRLEGVKATFPGGNRATLSAIATFTGLNGLGIDLSPRVSIAADGRLLATGSRVEVSIESIRAARLQLPSAANRWVEEAVNPLADLSGLPIPLKVSRLEGIGTAIQANVRQRDAQP